MEFIAAGTVAVERFIRRMVRAVLFAPFRCLHPVRICRRESGPATPMGMACYTCGKWLGPLNLREVETHVASVLAARQSRARENRAAKPKAFPPPVNAVRLATIGALLTARDEQFRIGFVAGVQSVKNSLEAIERVRQNRTERSNKN